jgi:hypothetical protein
MRSKRKKRRVEKPHLRSFGKQSEKPKVHYSVALLGIGRKKRKEEA